MGNRRTATVPEVGVEFELTLDFNTTDPIGMVPDGYDRHDKWKFEGNKPNGVQARRFKLVQVGYQLNLDAVRTALAQHGNVPEGQWQEAFKTAYPTPDGQGPIGIADPSWVDNVDDRRFPYLGGDGGRWNSNFHWAVDAHFEVFWRWLLQVVGARKL